jgi:hypothetical protein
MVQGFRQLEDSAVDLSTWYADPEHKADALNRIVGMGRENASLARHHNAGQQALQ